ncbi:MAG: sulfopyruvate decarboxylase subunit beta, partial [Candidatus Omnitrophica bacterium]|nr:sulfopyruvate decarboxylase subunit beta [Candidatus Omnitrophota bacterium]
MKRITAINVLLELVDDDVLVANIGDVCKELYSAGDRKETFYMLGSMGLASSVGLGLSLANSRRVIVLDGDGSVLMNLGSVATIAAEAPGNFKLVIFDNKAYGSTGYQRTPTSGKCRLTDIVKAAGLGNVQHVSDLKGFRDAMEKILAEDAPAVLVAEVEKEEKLFPVVEL